MMSTIRVVAKTASDGTLSLCVATGKPETECEVLVLVPAGNSVPKPDQSAWPEGYFDLAGSIDDESFVRPVQGDFSSPVEFP